MKTAALNTSRLERLVTDIVHQAKEMESSLEKYKKDPGKNEPQIKNIKDAAHEITTNLKVLDRTLEAGKTASRVAERYQDLIGSSEKCITGMENNAFTSALTKFEVTLQAELSATETEFRQESKSFSGKDETSGAFHLLGKKLRFLREAEGSLSKLERTCRRM